MSILPLRVEKYGLLFVAWKNVFVALRDMYCKNSSEIERNFMKFDKHNE